MMNTRSRMRNKQDNLMSHTLPTEADTTDQGVMWKMKAKCVSLFTAKCFEIVHECQSVVSDLGHKWPQLKIPKVVYAVLSATTKPCDVSKLGAGRNLSSAREQPHKCAPNTSILEGPSSIHVLVSRLMRGRQPAHPLREARRQLCVVFCCQFPSGALFESKKTSASHPSQRLTLPEKV